ncbi:hypothetical protein WEB32_04960 [Streptomyces netropsis]|uniref:hypothetical protein n=1 Tax=Streptomyces netropsis TaxID=55404 RepID=UPI0030D0884A
MPSPQQLLHGRRSPAHSPSSLAHVVESGSFDALLDSGSLLAEPPLPSGRPDH